MGAKIEPMALKDFAKVIKTKFGDVLVRKAQDHNGNNTLIIEGTNEQGEVHTSTYTCDTLDNLDLQYRSYDKEAAEQFIAFIELPEEPDFHPDQNFD